VQKFDNYSRNSRVFVEDFAAKLPTPPQLTVYAPRLFKMADALTSSAKGIADNSKADGAPAPR
jgi:hypothetical protein